MLKSFRQILSSTIEEAECECGRDKKHDENNGNDNHEPWLIYYTII